ncbi:MAG: methyltransferase domain-containing protein [Candidatus Omnitrophica bacterium]|nr:methyltransferase domain-containing protein [Candidatus Omnitrophota bacterium]
MHKTVRKVLRAVADYDPDYFDMYADAAEAMFARLYVERILRHASAAGIRQPATLLEAGCQAGRLVVPFARAGFRVTGIDTSGFALRRAREHAKAAGVDAAFIQGDLLAVLRRQPAPQFDVVVCAEVVYLSPQHRQMLEALAAAVRPGGLLCVSHRPKMYYLLEALRQYDVTSATDVLRRGEGPFRDSAYYNWQTPDELRALYRSLGLRCLAVHPIDRLAWLAQVDVKRLSEPQRAQWVQWELELPDDTAGDCARYLLIVAERPAESHA